MHKKTNKTVKALLACLGVCLGSSAVYAADPAPRDFRIEPQSVSKALKAFAAQADMQLIFTEKDAGGAKSAGVTGTKSAREALQEILKGTGLEFEFTANNVVVVRKASAAVLATKSSDPPGDDAKDTRKEGKSDSSSGFRVGQVDQGSTGPQVASDQNSKKDREEPLSEIVVTGTHIRGAGNSASPLQVFTRDDIDRSGLGSVAQFIETRPQNLGNASDNTVANVAGGSQITNASYGSGVNLRGLGADSTLVLINGHRVAPGNFGGSFVDISLIPLSAVDRIEILTDGASAIYGSDAVGGVVNIIMRKHYEGSETRARYASVSHGGRDEVQIGETVGHDWQNGSALLSYEFLKQTPLNATDRSYTDTAISPYYLLPEARRQDLFFSAQQDVVPGFNVFADAIYGKKTVTTLNATSQYSLDYGADIRNYGATVGGRAELGNQTAVEVNASYGKSESSGLQNYVLPGNFTFPLNSTADTRIESFEAKLTGPLWAMPAGSILYAVGAQYRRETLDQDNNGAALSDGRNIAAEFLELHVPLIGSKQNWSSGSRLELSLADRNEHYSEFGSTNNPKIGIAWRPTNELKLRGTYGTSFVAPLLQDLNPVPSQVVAFNTSSVPGATPLTGGDINALIVVGGNAHLRPQTADTWTFGADWDNHIGLKANLTFYDIAYKNRITDLQSAGYNPELALPQAAILGPKVVQFNPSNALVQSLIASPTFQNFGADLSTGVGAIVNSTRLNLSAVNTRGIDFSIAYQQQTGIADVQTGLDGTYTLKYDTQFTTGTPNISDLSTPYNPARVKMRGHIMLSNGPVTGAVFVNYVGIGNDPQTTPGSAIASWTTLDLSASYDCSKCSGRFGKWSVILAVQNVANRDPPFVPSPPSSQGLYFDGANANALGRYISLQGVYRLW